MSPLKASILENTVESFAFGLRFHQPGTCDDQHGHARFLPLGFCHDSRGSAQVFDAPIGA